MEAKIRKMELQAKESEDFQQPPGARKSQGSILPFSIQKKHYPANTLISDFWPPE